MFSLLLSLALAGTSESLTQAADADLAEDVRMDAFNSLVMDFERVRPELEVVVHDDDHDARERWIAARVMGQSHSPDAKTALLALCDDPMPAMRAAAASALGDLGYKDTADRVGELLKDDAVIVRVAAADALGLLKAEASARHLESALNDRKNYYRGESLFVRRHFVEALGEIGAWSSVPALIACFDDRDASVQDAALVSLRKIVGYDFAEGRDRDEHMAAWRRWYAAEYAKGQ
jgi:HEAT repeat protein